MITGYFCTRSECKNTELCTAVDTSAIFRNLRQETPYDSKNRVPSLGGILVFVTAWAQQKPAMDTRVKGIGGGPGMDRFHAAIDSPPGAREAALKNLVKTEDEEVATEAARWLIKLQAAAAIAGVQRIVL